MADSVECISSGRAIFQFLNSIYTSFVTPIASIGFICFNNEQGFTAAEESKLSQLLIIKLYNPDFEKLLMIVLLMIFRHHVYKTSPTLLVFFSSHK